ncbi:hypothetical protein F7725_027168 [Dissostichus mawsoni]|uniref:Uncharacterized protein n=1 Tax=Dissostichus mawsoni TaxID=36200 RepID=A0A7J5XC74_DISMA|nr:hypothetical protein F7725_027168 [Dissostichus mawsoni]
MERGPGPDGEGPGPDEVLVLMERGPGPDGEREVLVERGPGLMERGSGLMERGSVPDGERFWS